VTAGHENPGLYVHLPFCSAICPYRDFYVLTGDPARRRQFVHHLLQEIELCGEEGWPGFVQESPVQPFDTIYFGGGTPSILALEELSVLREGIIQHLPVVQDPWIGLEANPEDVTAGNLAEWKAMGVRFLSLGIQSFESRYLEFLGRAHDPQDCRNSVVLARQSGIETLSIDLIYGLPGQTPGDWQSDLAKAVELEPDHLSCYQLTIEPGTPFGFRRRKGQLSEMAPERQAELFFLTHNELADRGLVAYEVSSFASASHHHSRHNSKYWSHTPYLGVGPSAHSFASRQRWWNWRKIKLWAGQIDNGRSPIQEHETLTAEQLILESLMLGLRTPRGIDLASLPGDTQARVWDTNGSLIEDLVQEDLVRLEERRVIPTLAGLAVAESIACRFDISSTRSPQQPGIC
jgi:oxygen-independent coproporphyrinogen-3 oxidase